MKKGIALVLAAAVMLALAGCGGRSMDEIIAHEPSIVGTVEEARERSILVANGTGEYWVSLDVENKDSMTHFRVGDEVVVYYDGNVAESDAMQIQTVYAITLRTPADRAESGLP